MALRSSIEWGMLDDTGIDLDDAHHRAVLLDCLDAIETDLRAHSIGEATRAGA